MPTKSALMQMFNRSSLVKGWIMYMKWQTKIKATFRFLTMRWSIHTKSYFAHKVQLLEFRRESDVCLVEKFFHCSNILPQATSKLHTFMPHSETSTISSILGNDKIASCIQVLVVHLLKFRNLIRVSHTTENLRPLKTILLSQQISHCLTLQFFLWQVRLL